MTLIKKKDDKVCFQFPPKKKLTVLFVRIKWGSPTETSGDSI